jgi:tetratricopeptide (TPR) repeat protein
VTQPTIPTPRQLNVNPVDPRAQHQLRLGEARVALERNDYRSALTSIESLINDAPDYTEATALRQKILSERLEAARRQVAEAEELVKNGRLPEAIDAIRRAAATDPSVSVAPRINEIRAKMEQEGQEAFENGMNYSQATRPDQAIPLLQKAWRYLPDGHRDKPKARAELERLGAPVR